MPPESKGPDVPRREAFQDPAAEGADSPRKGGPRARARARVRGRGRGRGRWGGEGGEEGEEGARGEGDERVEQEGEGAGAGRFVGGGERGTRGEGGVQRFGDVGRTARRATTESSACGSTGSWEREAHL